MHSVCRRVSEVLGERMYRARYAGWKSSDSDSCADSNDGCDCDFTDPPLPEDFWPSMFGGSNQLGLYTALTRLLPIGIIRLPGRSRAYAIILIRRRFFSTSFSLRPPIIRLGVLSVIYILLHAARSC